MFNKVRAISIYKQMLADLIETKKLFEENNINPEIDRGIIIISNSNSNKKLIDYLEALASSDNYNFKSSDVLRANGEEAVLLSIDNEKKSKSKRKAKILKMDNYRKK